MPRAASSPRSPPPITTAHQVEVRFDLIRQGPLVLDDLAVPYSRSGLMIDFPVSLSRGATVRVLDSSGEPLPAGTQLRSTDGSSSGQIARDGLAYITGLGIGEIEFLAEVPNAECRFVIEISENFELLPYLGETICLVE